MFTKLYQNKHINITADETHYTFQYSKKAYWIGTALGLAVHFGAQSLAKWSEKQLERMDSPLQNTEAEEEATWRDFIGEETCSFCAAQAAYRVELGGEYTYYCDKDWESSIKTIYAMGGDPSGREYETLTDQGTWVSGVVLT